MLDRNRYRLTDTKINEIDSIKSDVMLVGMDSMGFYQLLLVKDSKVSVE